MSDSPSSRLRADQVRALRRGDFTALAKMGAFRGESLELLEGVLCRMNAEGPRHAAVVDDLNMLLTPPLAGRAHVRIRGPFAAADDAQPVPDLAVIFPGKHTHDHPASAFLVVEVADGTLQEDREVKAPLYARAAVMEYWLVNLEANVVEVHRTPHEGRYSDVWRFLPTDMIALAAFPDVILKIGDFLD